MEAVGTTYQSAMADLKDVAMVRAIMIETPQLFQKNTSFCFNDFFIIGSFIFGVFKRISIDVRGWHGFFQ